MEQKKKTLSASSIKSLETCSWIFWSQYEKRIPQRSNEGAMRGTIAHLVFELLLNKRHEKHFKGILLYDSIEGSPPIKRLIIKHLTQNKILSVDNYELMDKMILVGLKNDFYGANVADTKVSEPEFRFEYENASPFYRIRGYIDKHILYPNGLLKIVDYKSSKSKFSSDELGGNIQALTYSLIGYKLLNAKDAMAEFIFLRYPRQPIQQVHPTKEQLDGFEHYLAYIYNIVENFSEEDATNNMAAYHDKNKWLCKAGSWTCPYLKAFDYYALINEDGSLGRTAMEKEDLNPETGQTLKKMKYGGCPSWKRDNFSGL